MRAVRVEEQYGAQHSRALGLHRQHELAQRLGEQRAGRDRFEYPVLAVAPQLGAPPRRALVRFLQRALDDGRQPIQAVLHHVIGGALPQGVDRAVLADGARDEHERHAGGLLAGQLERHHPVESIRHAEVRQDDVRVELHQRAEILLARLDAPEFQLVPQPAQLAQLQLGVVLHVLEHEDPQRLAHGRDLRSAGMRRVLMRRARLRNSPGA
jgi:hypothetical protein